MKIHADEDRLLQVLTNLISNAVKHSPTGERVSIEVSWKQPGELLRFLVRDNGPGIPADMRTRIFEKFQQADSPGSRAKGGTGLGLSIAKAIVEAFGGIIAVECPEAGGSEFHFDLPVPGYEGGA